MYRYFYKPCGPPVVGSIGTFQRELNKFLTSSYVHTRLYSFYHRIPSSLSRPVRIERLIVGCSTHHSTPPEEPSLFEVRQLKVRLTKTVYV